MTGNCCGTSDIFSTVLGYYSYALYQPSDSFLKQQMQDRNHLCNMLAKNFITEQIMKCNDVNLLNNKVFYRPIQYKI